jgi:phosphoglycolate phosphatase
MLQHFAIDWDALDGLGAAAPEALVFDLDGTLVDSAPDIAHSLNNAVATLGVPPFDLDDVHTMIGAGSRVLLDRAFDAAGLDPADPRKADVFNRFMEHYERETAAGRGLYPGALDLLAGLGQRAVRRGLCTNKPEPVTRIAVQALGLASSLDVIVGARDDRPKKPHPAMLEATLAALGVAPGRAVMVGDSQADIGVARAVGCPVVAVSFGYSKVPARELGADAVIDDLRELPAALATLAALRGGAASGALAGGRLAGA